MSTEACGEALAAVWEWEDREDVRCVNPTGHKGAHAWHHDSALHVTIVWWPTKPPPKRKRKAKTQPTQEELL